MLDQWEVCFWKSQQEMGTVKWPVEMSIGISNPSAALQPLLDPGLHSSLYSARLLYPRIPTVLCPSGRRPPSWLLAFPLAFFYEISH